MTLLAQARRRPSTRSRWWASYLCLSLASLGAACGTSSADDTAPGATTWTTSPGGDGGATSQPQAIITVQGDAVADTQSYAGAERTLAALDDGTPLCTIRVDLVSATTRGDCTDCLWAFDLVATGTQVELDEGCADVGLDAKTLADTPRAYGYAEEYIGHSSVLMTDQDGHWQGVAYAGWDQASGALSYSWEQERVTLP